jgi:hypothetical protein
VSAGATMEGGHDLSAIVRQRLGHLQSRGSIQTIGGTTSHCSTSPGNKEIQLDLFHVPLYPKF